MKCTLYIATSHGSTHVRYDGITNVMNLQGLHLMIHHIGSLSTLHCQCLQLDYIHHEFIEQIMNNLWGTLLRCAQKPRGNSKSLPFMKGFQVILGTSRPPAPNRFSVSRVARSQFDRFPHQQTNTLHVEILSDLACQNLSNMSYDKIPLLDVTVGTQQNTGKKW